MSITRRDASRSRKVYSYYRPRPVQQVVDNNSQDSYDVMVWNETPTGEVDGNNGTFVISYQPNPDKTLVFLNDVLQISSGVDYSLSDRLLIFNTAPKTGDKINVTYSRVV